MITIHTLLKIFFSLFLLASFSLPAKSRSLLEDGGFRNKSLSGQPRGFYESYKARNVGDVITVRVVEDISVLKQNDVQLSRQVDSSANFTFEQNAITSSTLTPETNDTTLSRTNLNFPNGMFNRNSDRSINVDSRDSFVTLVSAVILEVDPATNNMIIEGTRQVVVEGQTKSLYVRGIIHPKDVDPNNEVPSYKLANAQIQVVGSGALDKERDGGILYKVFKFLI